MLKNTNTLTDILNGYSKAFYKKQAVYIKHFDNLSIGNINLKKEEIYQRALSQRLPSLEEQEAYILKENLWSEDRNKEIQSIITYIKTLKKNKSKMFKNEDLKNINNQINQNELNLLKLKSEKRDLIGFTAEDHANKKINEYCMFISLFKDKDLNASFFSNEEFEDLENTDIFDIIRIYNIVTDNFSELNLRKIALSPTFLSLFNLGGDNIYNLFGKPIIYLTLYQIDIYGYARYFKNQLENAKNKPPDEYFEDPDKLIEWLESAKNIEELLDKTSKNVSKNDGVMATSIVGASKEDLEKAGVKQEGGISLIEEAKKRGGNLSMQDLMKLHGI